MKKEISAVTMAYLYGILTGVIFIVGGIYAYGYLWAWWHGCF